MWSLKPPFVRARIVFRRSFGPKYLVFKEYNAWGVVFLDFFLDFFLFVWSTQFFSFYLGKVKINLFWPIRNVKWVKEQHHLRHTPQTFSLSMWKKLSCYVKCLLLKTKTLKFLHIFTAYNCDTTLFAFFGCCDAISSHLKSFLCAKYWKVYGFKISKSEKVLKDFVIHRKNFHVWTFYCVIRKTVFFCLVWKLLKTPFHYASKGVKICTLTNWHF